MRKIYKYHVPVDDMEFGINVPEGAMPISAYTDSVGRTYIYYSFPVANEYTMVMKRVYIAYTGAPAKIGPYDLFIGTTHDLKGIVRHVYQLA